METQTGPSPTCLKPLHLLVVTDSPDATPSLVNVLTHANYDPLLEVVASPKELSQKITEVNYDAILAVCGRRAEMALETLEFIRKSTIDIPVVVVTEGLGDEAATECIKRGATDYVLEDRLDRLPAAINNALHEQVRRKALLPQEEQTRSAHTDWELTFDAFPDPVFLLDGDFRILRANRALAAMAGMELSQVIGQRCYQAVHGLAGPHPDCPYLRMLATGREERAEVAGIKNGKVFDAIVSPLFDSSGTVWGCVHVLRDITSRMDEEKVLQHSQATYRSLILGATYGIVRCDLAGKFVAANPALVTMLSYNSEEEVLAAHGVGNISRDPGEAAKLLRRCRETGQIAGTAAEWKRKDGTTIPVQLSGRAVLDRKGVLQGFELIVQDVSERRCLEDQLREAQKMQVVGRLAGGIAHDFNNLLTIVTGYSDLLLGKLDGASSLRHYAEEIHNAAEHAAVLTRQLLAFSRQQMMAPQILDLNAVVANMDKMLRRLIGEHIELTTVLDQALGPVKADPGQIEQVILNLAVHARDAMPHGGKLTLETANVELDRAFTHSHILATPGPHVMLAVSDTGCGMDAETLSHVFEPFFTTKGPGEGSGLGLATAYGIVRQSGGHIWASSEPGKGTAFKIYLSRVEETPADSPSRSGLSAPPRGKETILVVEDDELIRALVEGILQSYGYRVLMGSDPEQAVQICNNHQGPIHLLLTDVVMPKMSGRQLAEYMAFLRPEMKILYMSGYADDAIVHHGVLRKGIPFLQKPFTPNLLAQKVRELLDEYA